MRIRSCTQQQAHCPALIWARAERAGYSVAVYRAYAHVRTFNHSCLTSGGGDTEKHSLQTFREFFINIFGILY